MRKRALLKGYKYVDLKDAEAVSKGSLRIGTLASYSGLENGRADIADGAYLRMLDGFSYRGGDTGYRANIAAEIGYEVAEGKTVTFQGDFATIVEPPPPRYCFCSSSHRNDHAMMQKAEQAVFAISDLEGLARKLCQTQQAHLGRYRAAPVNYVQTRIDWRRGPIPPGDPFVKDLKYIHEDEVRITWIPKRLPAEVIFTPPDPAIARFLRRLC